MDDAQFPEAFSFPLDQEMIGASCPLEGPPQPCLLAIFGASGDLAGRKLLPALFRLDQAGALAPQSRILGLARTAWSDQEFQEHVAQALARQEISPQAAQGFLARLCYQPLVYDEPASYQQLALRLGALEAQWQTGGRRVFNLAIPPSLYATVATMIGQAGLADPVPGEDTWTRLVVEKPFGRDLASAQALNQAIGAHFGEAQVFRIDHYLAKETVQSVLMLRFANAIFEPLWNRNYIDHVSIIASETLGVEHRAGYYEQAGVLRDMFQNHMMQLMSLCALEPPSLFFADRVRDEKTKVFRSLRPFPLEQAQSHLVLGQYGPGQVGGQPVVGYRQEPGVSPESLSPTYALMKVHLDNWRWQGVPFYLLSGKRLAAKLTRMVIQFREVPHSLFRQVLGPHIGANRLVLGVYPQEGVSLSFQTKNPGPRVCLRSVNMAFDYHEGFAGPRPEAYEKALLDCMQGDQMLFWRQDGVELCWAYLDDLLRQSEQGPQRGGQLLPYPAGSWGPPQALELMAGRPAPWA